MITLIGIPFDFMGMTYYRTEKDISVGDSVVVKTPHGTFVGTIVRERAATEEDQKKKDFNSLFPTIERIATFSDCSFAKSAEEKGKQISKATQKQADQLKLNMKILKTYLDVDDDKALITFTSESRVDFRELVKILNGMFRMKIELRQIGPRDQARIVGGIGPCGLPLCCSTFLTSFDGISIAMAKNQLLAINIPKLSGQCGKLMCCLKYEDEAYSKMRPLYPKIGEKFSYLNKQYEVTGLNLLTDTITTYNGDNYESFTKEEYERVKKGLAKQDAKLLNLNKDVNAGVDLSGHGISDTNNRIAQIKKNEERRKEELLNKEKKNNQNNNKNRNNKNNQNSNKNRNNNGNRSFSGNQNHSFGGNRKGNQNHNFSQKPKSTSSSGFIPVSELSDSSILDITPIKKSSHDKK